jgi:hypothetical protein
MGMNIFNNSASFARPNDALQYAIGDLVANSTTAGSVVPLAIPVGGNAGFISLRLVRARLTKSGTSTTSATFRIHLYSQSPTVANGDNGAWSSNQAANWLGNIDISSMLAFSDGATGTGSLPSGSEAFIKASNNSGPSQQYLYALIANLGTYTPTNNETFTLTLEEVAQW